MYKKHGRHRRLIFLFLSAWGGGGNSCIRRYNCDNMIV